MLEEPFWYKNRYIYKIVDFLLCIWSINKKTIGRYKKTKGTNKKTKAL